MKSLGSAKVRLEKDLRDADYDHEGGSARQSPFISSCRVELGSYMSRLVGPMETHLRQLRSVPHCHFDVMFSSCVSREKKDPRSQRLERPCAGKPPTRRVFAVVPEVFVGIDASEKPRRRCCCCGTALRGYSEKRRCFRTFGGSCRATRADL
ncbi:hypothetical protein MRX96_027865 [Rhipicephalus microplus]